VNWLKAARSIGCAYACASCLVVTVALPFVSRPALVVDRSRLNSADPPPPPGVPPPLGGVPGTSTTSMFSSPNTISEFAGEDRRTDTMNQASEVAKRYSAQRAESGSLTLKNAAIPSLCGDGQSRRVRIDQEQTTNGHCETCVCVRARARVCDALHQAQREEHQVVHRPAHLSTAPNMLRTVDWVDIEQVVLVDKVLQAGHCLVSHDKHTASKAKRFGRLAALLHTLQLKYRRPAKQTGGKCTE
jgi:hypothetical protein